MMDKDTTDIVARVIKAGALRCNLWALGEVLSLYQEKEEHWCQTPDTNKLDELFRIYNGA